MISGIFVGFGLAIFDKPTFPGYNGYIHRVFEKIPGKL